MRVQSGQKLNTKVATSKFRDATGGLLNPNLKCQILISGVSVLNSLNFEVHASWDNFSDFSVR